MKMKKSQIEQYAKEYQNGIGYEVLLTSSETEEGIKSYYHF